MSVLETIDWELSHDCVCEDSGMCQDCFTDAREQTIDLVNMWRNKHDGRGDMVIVATVSSHYYREEFIYDVAEDLVDALARNESRIVFKLLDDVSDTAGNVWCQSCGGDFRLTVDERVQCVECSKFGYSTRLAGNYVCYTCGHMCECGE